MRLKAGRVGGDDAPGSGDAETWGVECFTLKKYCLGSKVQAGPGDAEGSVMHMVCAWRWCDGICRMLFSSFAWTLFERYVSSHLPTFSTLCNHAALETHYQDGSDTAPLRQISGLEQKVRRTTLPL